jgi:hypothetical protein
MADWAISSGDYMRPYRTQGSDACSQDYGPESTVQSYPVGALLERDTKVSTGIHRLRIASVSVSTVTSTAICGVAAEPASSVTDATRIFWPAIPQVEFMARTRGSTITSTNIGGGYGLFFDSTKNVFGVDLANTQSTSIRVIITRLIDAAGDSGGYVAFKFGTTPSVGSTTPFTSTNTFGVGAVPIRL